jgi:hypothetical protein
MGVGSVFEEVGFGLVQNELREHNCDPTLPRNEQEVMGGAGGRVGSGEENTAIEENTRRGRCR